MTQHSLFAKKQIDVNQFKNSTLERHLTAFGLTAMGVGAVVGAGIFITPGIIAAKYAGPGAMLSYLLAAVVCAMAAPFVIQNSLLQFPWPVVPTHTSTPSSVN